MGQVLHWYHSHHVQSQAFNVRDLVLRLVHSNKDRHKLSLPWEGPYIISKVLRPGTYKLKMVDGKAFFQRVEY
jgi:hypothetical protein